MKKLDPSENRGLFTHRCPQCRIKVRIANPDQLPANVESRDCFLCGTELEPLGEVDGG